VKNSEIGYFYLEETIMQIFSVEEKGRNEPFKKIISEIKTKSRRVANFSRKQIMF